MKQRVAAIPGYKKSFPTPQLLDGKGNDVILNWPPFAPPAEDIPPA